VWKGDSPPRGRGMLEVGWIGGWGGETRHEKHCEARVSSLSMWHAGVSTRPGAFVDSNKMLASHTPAKRK
jgi:hypothetical protein